MKIKFTHKYNKLKNDDGTIDSSFKLIDLIPVNLENLSEEFLKYDTDNGLFQLPKKGNYMMLIFQKNKGGIFTTLRRLTPEKLRYYTESIGKIFEVEFI